MPLVTYGTGTSTNVIVTANVTNEFLNNAVTTNLYTTPGFNIQTTAIYADSVPPYALAQDQPTPPPSPASVQDTRRRMAAARELLLSHLDEEQTEEWQRCRRFHVQTANGERTYRIREGITGNIRLIREGQEVEEYCIHPSGYPIEDTLLTQKLLLETDEEEFLRIANRTVLVREAAPSV
jgi:hypothetical protein